MLKDRQKSILDAVVQAHIRMARPIASQDLAGKLKPGVSPATIRNEMFELDELGFLEQPYTSAGRVPTDKGYRFFVDNLLDGMALRLQEKKMLADAFGVDDELEFVRELARSLSMVSGAFTAVGMADDDAFYETGFAQVLDEPEFEDSELVREFGHLADSFEEHLQSFFGERESIKREVLIGSENPMKDARGLSMIISHWKHPRGSTGFCAMVGPRRMNYAKNLSVMDFLKEFEE